MALQSVQITVMCLSEGMPYSEKRAEMSTVFAHFLALANLFFHICFLCSFLLPACLHNSLYPLNLRLFILFLLCAPSLIFVAFFLHFHFISFLPSLSFSASSLCSVMGREMFCALGISSSISFIVWVMVLSVSCRVAIWRALEQHKSDVPLHHSCSVKIESMHSEIFSFNKNFISLFCYSCFLKQLNSQSVNLNGAVPSELQCGYSHQSANWMVLHQSARASLSPAEGVSGYQMQHPRNRKKIR